jgi:hypothetical protein|tara:strand:- start:273 stop:773 length:501 start_codon:yes stop_codon:yes gene_type:complete
MSEEIKGSRYALGHAVRIKAIDDSGLSIQFKFQNFFINKDMTFDGNQYTFVPFGFSGVTVNRTGDGLEATLVFPNNDLTRGWAVTSIKEHYVMEVDVLIVDSDSEIGSHDRVHTYVGQVVGGDWDNVSLNLLLSSVLDAVGTDVPRRSLTRKLVGNLPASSNVRLQ